MKIAAVGEKEVLVGIRLAGVKTVFETSDPKEALEYIKKLMEQDIAIIIITQRVAEKTRMELKALSRGKAIPVLVTFPDVDIPSR
ncbi:MAG: V-type ATP synthase subunit F [Candidatus Bathyarchaeia archaeon]